MAQTVLIADDDEGVLTALTMLLKSEGYVPVTVASPKQVLAALHSRDFSLVLMDLNYSLDTTSGEEGLKLITEIRKFDDLVPIVVMTGWGTIEVAVDTMKKGANDFVQKPWEIDRLLAIIKNQIQLSNVQQYSQKLSQQNQLLQEEIDLSKNIIAESSAIRQVLNTLAQVSNTDVSVLLTGENGTGKSLFAHYLHKLSARRDSAFISVNMGAVR